MAERISRKADVLFNQTQQATTAITAEANWPATAPTAAAIGIHTGALNSGLIAEQVVIREIKDGTDPASVFVDFEPVSGASYQAQWFTDSAMTQQVGDVTVTASEFTATGLTAGQQYWFRIRAVRAGENGPWSDPATRVANI